MSTTPKTEGAEKKTTTYVVLRTFTPSDTQLRALSVNLAFVEVGRYTVTTGRSDQAKEQGLKQLVADEPETTSFEVVAVPEKSWQPERFQLEVPAPRFKRA